MTREYKIRQHSILLTSAKALWVKLPSSWRHRFWTVLGPKWQRAYARSIIARPALAKPVDSNSPLVVAGLFSSANGIGEAARSTFRSLEAAGLSPIAVDLSEPFAPVDMLPDIECKPMPDDPEGILILQLNGPETMSAMQHLGMDHHRSWYTIGYWAWELPSFPTDWDKAFRYLSEIWTISRFSAAALGSHPSAPKISVFGHAIDPPKGIRAARKKFGWQPEQLVFLTMADSMSSLERKNPFSTIKAFRRAFGDDPKKVLIVKTRNLERNPTAKADLINEIGDASNISLIDMSLSDEERWSLLKSVDVFVSLHRSEGFGLAVAESMALGKPVICTDWSGNMDFTHESSVLLVKSKLVPCHDIYGVYSDDDSKWAEIDIDDAVEKFVQVAQSGTLRKKLAQSAKKVIQTEASTVSVGSSMKARLNAIPDRTDLS